MSTENDVDGLSNQTNGFDLSIGESERPKSVLSEAIEQEAEARILVLYTGGTIGMMRSNHQGVYEPKANFLVKELKKLPMFHDAEYAEKFLTEDINDFLVMPLSRGKRIFYRVEEYEPLLDSSNMNMTDWVRIATDIHKNYDSYDGFVVLHGTDTMAYTASALSFICENLGKPVVLTGSQIPIFEIRSDGRDNFLSSLIVIGHYSIPEVMVCFDNKILRGNRTIKNDSTSFAAFTSPNLPPLATLEISITVNWDAVFRPKALEKFTISTNPCRNVGLLRLFPGITVQTVRAFLSAPMQGVVLQTYGVGNAPSNRPDLLQAFQEATNMGVIIVNITQCTRGFVDASYETGKVLVDVGVIPGGDMTPEAALTKLSYILGKETYTHEKKRAMMKRNLRGEMIVVIKEEISMLDSELIEGVAQTLCLSSKEEIVKLKDALYPNLMCTSAMTGNIAALEKLRLTGGNFSSPNQDGRTALHVACREGQLEVVQYLLHHGTNVHCKDLDKKTPLIDAIHSKQYSIISLLVQTGALITLQPVNVAMELCRAASQEDIEILKAWKLAGADLNESDYDNRTALHVAVNLSHINTVNFLLENGASWMLVDAFGNTALNQAELLGNKDILNLIKETSLKHNHGILNVENKS